MKFSYFPSVKAPKGEKMTNGALVDLLHNNRVQDICAEISRTDDKDKISELKKKLPIITWQAYFPGKRVAKEAEPSGLFMLDIDHVDNPFELWSKICRRVEELGIVVAHATPSGHGLRLVAKCRKEFTTLAECQRWLAEKIGVEFDEVCKDFARSSFVVPSSYVFFMDGKTLWTENPEEGTVYKVDGVEETKTEETETTNEAPTDGTEVEEKKDTIGDTYHGVSYERICKEWMEQTGGEPERGDRNVRLHRLATRLRYITDFNAAAMMRIMPRYGISEREMRSIVGSALKGNRASEMPLDLKMVLDRIDKEIKLGDAGEDEDFAITTETSVVPSLPPVLRQWYNVAPDDFKQAVTLCQLPILGALGSRLRARYIDDKMHSPSFQVSLEAPQASGKSFLVRLVEYELKAMMQCDEEARAKEREYNEKIAQIRATNTKIKKDELPERPNGIIRYVPATMSITMLLKRMEGARGLHLFALAEEIDTVTRAFKRGFSNFSEALRVSFDNSLYGQDYASETSWSGNIPLYYNCLFSGTPKAMRRFYPDIEDGLVSRVLFVTLPDQFAKPMPVWGKFTDEEKLAVDTGLERLNDITLIGDEVQPEHVLKMDFVNKAMQKWILMQQQEAVRTNNRTIDVFCRRSAVVGFRAAMIAFFLWGEKKTPAICRNTVDFAIWVANCMLKQHLLRFDLQEAASNTFSYRSLYEALPSEFTFADMDKLKFSLGIKSHNKGIVYKWSLAGLVTTEDTDKHSNRTYKKIQ